MSVSRNKTLPLSLLALLLISAPAWAQGFDDDLGSTAGTAIQEPASQPYQQLFQVSLSSAQSVPPVTTNTTGRLRLLFNGDLSEARFALFVDNAVDVIVAHLHCAPAGIAGPVVVPLFGPGPGIDIAGQLSTGTITNADIVPQDPPSEVCGITINNVASLLEAIRRDRVYVNVHTAANPAGETRAQLYPGVVDPEGE